MRLKPELEGVLAFLFDLDGVVIDSEREYTRIWSRISEEFPTGVEDFACRIKGTTLEKILETYYPDSEVRKKVEKRLYEEEAKMHYEYCEGAREFLTYLRENRVPMALYTSSNQYKMRHLYEDRPELASFFDVIVTSELVHHSKPDPEGYLIAADKLGFKPAECCVVEDSLQGVKAGRRAGGKVVGVAGTMTPGTLRPYSDIIVKDLTELIDE